MLELEEVVKPYPGLRPFTAAEGAIFRGREEHTDRLLDILQQHRFLAVIGPSGSGKSSLVRAGLLPSLALGSIGNGTNWRIATLRPGNRPLQRLSQALLTRSAMGTELLGPDRIPDNGREITGDVAAVEAELRRGPLGLVDLMKDVAGNSKSEPFNLLVLVDQFEELFTYVDAGSPQEDESESFVNLLLTSRATRVVSIFVALTMRTDFLGQCVRFLDLPDAINRGQYLTPRLTRKQARLAIIGPARVFGGDVDSKLVDELINEVGNDPDQLPILQHALARMWDFASKRDPQRPEITWKDFREAGGVRNALSSHAEQVLISLGPSQEPLAEMLFRAVTEHRGTDAGQAVRRPQTIGQIAVWSGRHWKEFESVVKAFAQEDVNFLTQVGKFDHDTVVDISHEALIRQWEKLRAWVSSEARRAGDYWRWKERRADFIADPRALLTGGTLARAVEWLEGADSQSFAAKWRPTKEWATRYDTRTVPAAIESDSTGRVQFHFVREFIERSREESEAEGKRIEQQRLSQEEAERKRLDERRVAAEQLARAETIARAEAERRADEQRARAESEARGRQQTHAYARRVRTISIFLALALVVAIFAAFQAYRSQEREQRAATDAQEAAQAAIEERDNARKARRDTQEALDTATRLKTEADQSRQEADEATQRAISARERETDRELSTRAFGYWLPLGLESSTLTPNERIALMKIAKSDLSLRQRFLDLLVENPDAAARFTRNPNEVIRAAIGVSPSMRRWFIERLKRDLAAPQAQIQLARTLALLELDGVESADVIVSLILKTPASARIRTPFDIRNFVFVSPGQNSLAILGQGLARFVRQSSADQARQLVNQLTSALTIAQNADQIMALGEGLSAAAALVPGPQAQVVFEDLVSAVETTKDNNRLLVLGRALVAVTGKLTEQEVLKVADRLTHPVVPETQLVALSLGLAAMVEKLPDARTEQATKQLLLAVRATSSSSQLTILGDGLVAGVTKLTVSQCEELARSLLVLASERSDSGQLRVSSRGLTAVSERFDETAAQRILRELENMLAIIATRAGATQLETLSSAIKVLAFRLREQSAAVLASRFLTMADAMTNPTGKRAMALALTGVAGNLHESMAESAVRTFLAAIPTTTTQSTLELLGEGLAAAAAKLPVTQSRTMIDDLFDASGGLTDPGQLDAMSVGFAALTKKLSQDQAQELSTLLVAAVESRSSSYQGFLSRALIAVADQFSEEASHQMAQLLVGAIQKTTETARLQTLGQGLAAFAAKLGERRSREFANPLLVAADNAQSGGQLAALGVGIASIARELPAAEAARSFERLRQAIEATTDRRLAQAIGRGLATVAADLTEDQCQHMIETLLTSLATKTDGGQIDAVVQGLTAVTGRLIAGQSQEALEKLLVAVSTTTNSAQLRGLGSVVSAIARGVPPSLFRTIEERLLAAIRSATDADQVVALGNALLAGGRLQPQTLVELTGYPALRETFATRIRQQYPDAPGADQGFWPLVAWLQTRFPRIDLDKPPQ